MTSETECFDGYQQLTIHDFERGPYPARVRIAIAELGLQDRFNWVRVDLTKGEHKTALFRQKNYSGTLPVLELADGTYIAECTAITVLIDSLKGPSALTGRTSKEQGLVHMMTRRVELEVLDTISAYFHHATPGLGPKVEVYQNKDWGMHQRDKALRGLAYFDGLLATQTFVATEAFSMADIALVGALIFFELLKVEIPPSCTHVLAWYERVKTRPSVQNWKTMSAKTPSASRI